MYDEGKRYGEAMCMAFHRSMGVDARVVRIRNTLMLEEIEVSEALLPEVLKRSDLTVLGDPKAMAFDAAGTLAKL